MSGFTNFAVLDVDDFAKAIEAAFEGKTTVLHRMRLSCTFRDKNGKNLPGTDSK